MNKVSIEKFNIKLLLAILSGFLIRIPALFYTHLEIDEVVYKTLIRNLSLSIRSYTLQGDEILEILPRYIYDHKIFHHPPLFTILGKLFYMIFGDIGGLLIPIISSLFTAYFVWKIALVVFDQKHNKYSLAYYSTLIFLLDPINIFTSTRVWADSLLTLFLTASLYCLLAKKDMLLSFFLVFAVLTKATSVFVIPFFLVFKFINDKKLKTLLLFLLPILFATLWQLLYYRYTGIFFLDTRANSEFIALFPFVERVINRPIPFYFIQLILLNPLFLLSYYIVIRTGWIQKISLSKFYISVLFGIFYLGLFTVIGARGGTFQMRYVLPAIPTLSLAAAKWFGENKAYPNLLMTLFLLISTITGLVSSYFIPVADPIPLSMIMW